MTPCTIGNHVFCIEDCDCDCHPTVEPTQPAENLAPVIQMSDYR